METKALVSGVNREEWWPEGGKHEISFAIHLFDEDVYLYENDALKGELTANEWKAAFGKDWLTGTIDYLGTVWTVYGERPWVDDLKTGTWPVDPIKSRQLRSYLLLPWILEGMPIKALYYRSITQWTRYPVNSQPLRSGLDNPISGLDLLTHLEDLRWSVENPDRANPTDEGCRFCECKSDCDAYMIYQTRKQ